MTRACNETPCEPLPDEVAEKEDELPAMLKMQRISKRP